MKLKSAAFSERDMIPKKYTCDGPNISPPLMWEFVPNNTKSFVLISDDPDAPMGTWVHWVLFNIPAEIRELPENIPPKERTDFGAIQGRNDFRRIGYGGPCPPGGTHRYFFKLYALSCDLNLKTGSTKSDALREMKGHVLGECQLMGRYKRQ